MKIIRTEGADINRIIVIGDFMRGADTFGNIKWLSACLSSAVEKAGGTVEIMCGQENGGVIDTKAIFDELDLPQNASGWARYTNGLRWPEKAMAAFNRSTELPNTWVVGFSLPPILMRRLSSRNVPFLDLEIHPARFAADIFLRARTNCADMAQLLEMCAIDESDLWCQAALNKGHQAVFGANARYGNKANVAIFVGQSRLDASLICDGEIKVPVAFIDEINSVTQNFEYVFICPHPYEPDNSHLHELASKIDNAVMVSDPIYDLLCSDVASKIISLSSSVIAEAPYFGKKTVKLINPDSSTESMKDVLLGESRIGPSCFTVPFWRHLFEGIPYDDRKDYLYPDLLRRSYGRAWGYGLGSPSGPLPTLAPGTSIAPKGPVNLLSVLLFGWNASEEHHVWSNGASAWIGFLITPACKEVIFHVADSIHDWRPNCSFGFRQASLPKNSTVYISPGAENAEVVLPIVLRMGNDLAIFEISCERPFCPLSEGFEPPDSRTLGVALRAVEVR